MKHATKGLTVVLAAGGTGGHVFPAKALAELLQAEGHHPVFITDKRTANYLKLKDMPVHIIPASSPGRGLIRFPLSMIKIAWGMAKASYYLHMASPNVVIGFGGYPSFPTMEVAVRRKYPTIIQEQNCVLGRVNRFLAPSVTAIAAAFDSVKGIKEKDQEKIVPIGNPVRETIRVLRDKPYPDLSENSALNIAVIGGSQGATVFSEVVPHAILALPEALKRRVNITQQCRPADIEAVKALYQNAGIQANVATFFDTMEEVYGNAHMLIGRAGASTIAEITTIGLPAILVPYPSALDDHQTANANVAAAGGGAWIMPQDNFTPESLAKKLEEITAVPEILIQAAETIKAAGTPDSTEKLLALVKQVAEL